MSYQVGSSLSPHTHGINGGYSYSCLSSSVDSDYSDTAPRSYNASSASRRNSRSIGRRNSGSFVTSGRQSPQPRNRPEPPALPTYKSLPSGLTYPKAKLSEVSSKLSGDRHGETSSKSRPKSRYKTSRRSSTSRLSAPHDLKMSRRYSIDKSLFESKASHFRSVENTRPTMAKNTGRPFVSRAKTRPAKRGAPPKKDKERTKGGLFWSCFGA